MRRDWNTSDANLGRDWNLHSAVYRSIEAHQVLQRTICHALFDGNVWSSSTRSGKNSLRIPPSLQSSVPLVAGSRLTRRLGRGPLGDGWSATICAPTSACLVAGHGSLRSGGIKIESLAKKSCPCLDEPSGRPFEVCSLRRPQTRTSSTRHAM